MTQDKRKEQLTDEAWEAELSAMMEGLGVEKAPASLKRKLRRIPREEKRRDRQWSWQQPRWVLVPAMAAAAVLAVGIAVMQPRQPSPADIEQARQELAVAFAYLDRVGDRTGSEIDSILGGELRDTVKGNLTKHILFNEQSLKEETT